jgi:hypothetical protein
VTGCTFAKIFYINIGGWDKAQDVFKSFSTLNLERSVSSESLTLAKLSSIILE